MSKTLIPILLLLVLWPLSYGTAAVEAGQGGQQPLKEGDVVTKAAKRKAQASQAQLTLSWEAVPEASSYNIYYGTQPGVTTSSPMKIQGVKKTSHTVRGLTSGTTYYFVVTAVNRRSESSASVEVFATPTIFSKPDLKGTWHFTVFATGHRSSPHKKPGWSRGLARVNDSGKLSVLEYEDSNSAEFSSEPRSLFITAKGVVTGTGPDGKALHGQMATDRKLIVAVSTDKSPGRLVILQKSDVPVASTGLTGRSFVFHQLNSGSSHQGSHGAGVVEDGGFRNSSTSTIAPPCLPDGPCTRRFSATSAGVVSSKHNPTFRGFLSGDGNMIVATETEGSDHRLIIYQMLGQMFVQSDLTGSFRYFALGWLAVEHGVLSISSTGDGLFTPPSLAGASGEHTFSISRAGIVAESGNPTFHGMLSYDKQVIVSTASTGTLAIGVK